MLHILQSCTSPLFECKKFGICPTFTIILNILFLWHDKNVIYALPILDPKHTQARWRVQEE